MVVDPLDMVDPAQADAAALRAMAAGDHEALRGFYDRYGRMVHAVAYRITGDAQAAEECTQDAFLAVWRSASSFDPSRSRPATWVCAIARNRALDAVRATGRRPVPSDELPERGFAPDSADVVADADAAVRVAEAMAGLPPAQCDVLQLAYFDGLSQTEIAQVLEVPLGTVKSRMRLALERMREVIGDLGPEA
ncbi:MAG: sigma-70 family RNA polymerase sigma factor [Acidobacteria bacterium]|nr:sigma-70 family RNA polymerase sigma factor [Acidobacteriota bacterium]